MTSRLIILECVIISAICSLLLHFYRYQVAEIYTNDADVIELVASLFSVILPVCLFVVSVCTIWNGLFIVLKQAKTS